LDLSKAKLPKIYKRNGQDCYLDPIRKRLIYITPEETVRQKVISYLLDVLEVPAGMMQVEEHLSHYGLKSRDRADIVVLGKNKDNDAFPLTVIECKAEKVPLDEKAMNQALDYSDALGSIYTLLINGDREFCYKYDETKKQYVQIEELPKYADMLTGDCVPVEQEALPERIPFEKLEEELRSAFAEDEDGYHTDISKYTPMELALPVFNLWEGLLDVRVKMPTGKYGMFELLEDYGVRMLTYGNAAGGQYYGPYRSFLVSIDGNTEIFSIGINTYWKTSWIDNNIPGKHPLTCICVAHDNEKTSHHALQMVVDEDAVAAGKTVKFYHNGRIAIGSIGSGKKSELREMVSRRYPKILTEGKYYLGSITADHMLRLDEPDVIDLVVNLISYSIVRDEFREIVKARK
jgi:hypothetical protein